MKNSEADSNTANEPVSLTEHLSALLDDETGDFEQRRVLDELKSNDDLRKSLSHYALIGESMRSSTPVAVAGSDFLAGIHAQIDSDPKYHEVQIEQSSADTVGSKTKSQSSWLRPMGGFALAVSVAAISFLGGQSYQLTNSSATTPTSMASTAPVTPTEMSPATGIIEMSVDKAGDGNTNEYRQASAHARSFLKRYVDSHMQYASTSTFVPSVRVIAYADYK